jgi:hypothetical protein
MDHSTEKTLKQGLAVALIVSSAVVIAGGIAMWLDNRQK